MKKALILLLVFPIFFLIWCKENINIQEWNEYVSPKESDIDFPSDECDLNMKLWKNKILNFKICIPVEWFWISDFKWNPTNLTDYTWYIWTINNVLLTISDSEHVSLEWSIHTKTVFWDKKILDNYSIENNKKEYISSTFILKTIQFWFNLKNKKLKTIINSIKPLTEK